MWGVDITDTVDRLARKLEVVTRLKDEERWDEAWQILARWLGYLVGCKVETLPKLTDTELLAGVLSNSFSYSAPYMRLMLIRLLKEMGDVINQIHPPVAGFGWYVKSLNLRLISRVQTDAVEEFAHLLPEVDSLVAAIGEAPLPARTQILVIGEYERRGEYGRMRDSFRKTQERVPDAPKLLAYGIITFTRLAERWRAGERGADSGGTGWVAGGVGGAECGAWEAGGGVGWDDVSGC